MHHATIRGNSMLQKILPTWTTKDVNPALNFGHNIRTSICFPHHVFTEKEEIVRRRQDEGVMVLIAINEKKLDFGYRQE